MIPMSRFKLIIATTGGFTDFDLLRSKLDALLVAKHPDLELVLGFSLAGDQFGRQYAEQHGYPFKVFTSGFLHMESMVSYADGAAVAWDGASPGTGKLIEQIRAAGKPCKVIRFEAPAKGISKRYPPAEPRNAVVIDGEVLIPETKKKRKPASSGQKEFKHPYKDIFESAHKVWFQQQYPSAWKDGHYIPSRLPDVTTANGMASYIVDHCAWTGNYANRINVMGRQINGKHIKSSTKKGTPDVDILINSVPIKAEIKINKDSQSDAQIKQQAAITKAGGNYYIFKSIDDYLDIFFQYCVKQRSIF